MAWFRTLHRWIGLLIGLQVALWMISGLMMGLLDHDKVQGMAARAVTVPPSLGGSAVVEPDAIRRALPPAAGASTIELRSLLDRRVYRVVTADSIELFDAVTGSPVSVSEDAAAAIAREDYAGEGAVVSVSRVNAPMVEIRKHQGPAWRVDFDDGAATSIYVSAQDGRILERRNDTWRLFDIFWMLHIMDYVEREDFNNALVILCGLVAAFFSVTGLVLLFDGFGKDDFLALIPARWRAARAPITVHGPAGEVISRFDATRGQRLYDALAGAGLVLPSNCGGGGTCGLCEVALGPQAPLSEADQRLLPAARRDAGARLSCQARVSPGLSVAIAREALEARNIVATVVRSRCVTPFIREIRLAVRDNAFEFRAGSYVHVVVPPHRIPLEDLSVPPNVRRTWGREVADSISESAEEVRRAYSLAAPSRETPGELVLNVRLMLPPVDSPGVPAGTGSTYMWSLEPGDSVELLGPLGEFHAEPDGRDLIVIGGGAGMAPLRAIIRDQLVYEQSGRQIDYWYGARTCADLYYVEEFDEIASKYSNFRWQPVLSQPDFTDKWSGPIGLVHEATYEALLRGHPNPGGCRYLLCGPPAMLAATRQMLVGLGVPEQNVSFDDFGI